jgi:hypothetical protein
MTSLDMGDVTHAYTSTQIDQIVTQTSAGNFALGYLDENGGFIVGYVGRSDGDVNSELKNYLQENYDRFKFSYATSSKDAFDKECKNYHEFSPKGNKIHPRRPDNHTWKCRRCTTFGKR